MAATQDEIVAIVDEVNNVIKIEGSALKPPPSIDDDDYSHILGITETEDELITIYHLYKNESKCSK